MQTLSGCQFIGAIFEKNCGHLFGLGPCQKWNFCLGHQKEWTLEWSSQRISTKDLTLSFPLIGRKQWNQSGVTTFEPSAFMKQFGILIAMAFHDNDLQQQMMIIMMLMMMIIMELELPSLG